MPSYPSAYYVYLLCDPLSGVAFYCGKGQRDRAWQHARAVGRGDLSGNARKAAKIQEILTRGDAVEIQIVAEYELEDDALEHEFEIVDSMPELTNVMPGGGGGPGGRRLTATEIAAREKARQERIVESRQLLFAQCHAHNVKRTERILLNNPKYVHHRAEIALWMAQNPVAPINPKDVWVKKRQGEAGYDMTVHPGARPPRKKTIERQRRMAAPEIAKLTAEADAERENRLKMRKFGSIGDCEPRKNVQVGRYGRKP